MALEDNLTTEALNPASRAIDAMSALEIAELMNAEDLRVVEAVRAATPAIAKVIEAASERLPRGGRLFYIGAGTSGRLGVLDASECPPTFSTPPGMVVGIIAGGQPALTRAIEGAEDDADQGAADLKAHDIKADDVVVGIATSGRTPYVIGAVDYARTVGAFTAAIVCNSPSILSEHVDVPIELVVGPEVLAGSTRLKSGTATKMALNTISTGAMVRIGKTYGHWMVDLKSANEKLRLRTRRFLRQLGGVDDATATAILERCNGALKAAIVVARTGTTPEEALQLLEANGGQIRGAIKAGGGTLP